MTTLELSILDCGAVGKLGVVQRVFDMLGKTNFQGSACFGMSCTLIHPSHLQLYTWLSRPHLA